MNAPEGVGAWRRTSPVAVVFYVLRFLRRLLTDGLPALAPLTAAFAASENLLWSWFGLAALLGAALLVAGAVLGWLRFRFRLADGLVQVRRGVLLREEVTVDFDRVQNVNIREPFYMRPFGLASLGIDTAGSAGKEVTIAGIGRGLAVELRGAMLAGDRASAAEVEQAAADGPAAAATEAEAMEDGEVLLRHDARAIAIYGLTASSLLWVAVVLGFLFSTADSVSDGWGDQLSAFAVQAANVALNFGIDEALLAVVTVLGVILLLPLLSVLGAFFRYHGFVLRFDGETYRRSSGLISRNDESVKRHKIQEVVWKQNALARLFRRLHLKLAVAQAGQAAQASQSGIPIPGSSFLVPSLTSEEAARLSAHMLPGTAPAEISFSRVDRRMIVRYLLLGWSLPVIAASVTPILLGGPLFALLIPAGFAVGAAVMTQLWRRLGYAVLGELGAVRTGFLGSRVSLFPLFKVQRVDLRQTPGQRRKGLAHLTIHLASGTHTLPYVRLVDAERFRDLALYHAESDPRPWF